MQWVISAKFPLPLPLPLPCLTMNRVSSTGGQSGPAKNSEGHLRFPDLTTSFRVSHSEGARRTRKLPSRALHRESCLTRRNLYTRQSGFHFRWHHLFDILSAAAPGVYNAFNAPGESHFRPQPQTLFRSEPILRREKNPAEFQVQFKRRVFIFRTKEGPSDEGGMDDPLVALRKQRRAKDFTPQ